jgi:4-amino-4-deoxy-L-arabinose transferase-like glycosyltransferase
VALQTYSWKKILPFVALYFVYFCGLFMDIMEIDAAQYAAIAWEMANTNVYLETYQRGADYLDKPPLLFWVSAVAFKIFGVSNFAFRFFPVLLSFLGAYSTYRLAKLYYSTKVAYWAALFMASCQAVFLMNHDVRTDNMLTTFVAFSLWHLGAYLKNGKWLNLVAGFMGIGLAMLAKGPIGLVIPILTFGLDILAKRQWHKIFDWKYLVGLSITALILLPMCVGLYQQFDIHPEKTVNGEQGVSGLKFFFWTQSFGRITGENVWANNPDPFFLVHTTFWSFLPWTLFLIIAYIAETKRIFRQGFKKIAENEEIFVWCGYTLAFIALSQSKYQLNHYIYPIYPLGAILTAKWFEKMLTWSLRWLKFLQVWVVFQLFVFMVIVALLGYWILPLESWWVMAGTITGFAGAIWAFAKSKELAVRWIFSSFLGILTVNFFLNTHFYPTLMNKYQSESVVAKKVKNNPQKYDIEKFLVLGEGLMQNSIDFYSQKHVPRLPDVGSLDKGIYWIVCDQEVYEKDVLNSQRAKILSKEVFEDFHVSTLSPEFLNPRSRPQTLRKTYLLHLEKN